jgi:hypothetical protein
MKTKDLLFAVGADEDADAVSEDAEVPEDAEVIDEDAEADEAIDTFLDAKADPETRREAFRRAVKRLC